MKARIFKTRYGWYKGEKLVDGVWRDIDDTAARFRFVCIRLTKQQLKNPYRGKVVKEFEVKDA